MGDLLALGVTHYPLLGGQDAHMARILEFFLADPDVPAERKDPSNWPAEMRAEWSDDGGRAAAAKHRAELRAGFTEIRRRLDEFAPDAVVVWGDDQYENFHEDVIPAFCVMAYEDLDVQPWQTGPEARRAANFANAWGEPADASFRIHGRPDIGRYLADRLLEADFDVAYAYKRLHDQSLAHAFLNTVLFLDFDRTGFDHPVVPFQINCYGRRVIAARGRYSTFANEPSLLDPRSPSPRRCFDLGAATARVLLDSPYRIALIASSSWSHAFLVDKNWRLYPDIEADHGLYDALTARDFETWRNYSLISVEESGQQEMLNWFAIAGAIAESGAKIEHSSFVDTHIFNSNKCFLATAPVVAAGRR